MMSNVFDDVDALVQALAIEPEDPKMKRALHDRRRLGSPEPPSLVRKSRLLTPPPTRIKAFVRPLDCCRLELDSNERLTVRLKDGVEVECEEEQSKARQEFGCGEDKAMPRLLFHGTKVVGCACSEARAGDWLACILLNDRDQVGHIGQVFRHLGLILRLQKRRQGKYEFVGQAVLKPLLEPTLGYVTSGVCCPSKRGEAPVAFSVCFNREDLVVLAAQDRSSRGRLREVSFERLDTRVAGFKLSSFATALKGGTNSERQI